MNSHPLAKLLQENDVDTSSFQKIHSVEIYKIHGLVVHGSQAVETWKKLRYLVETTKHWPVILGDSESLDMIREVNELHNEKSVKKVIDDSAAITAEQWIIKRAKEDGDYCEAPLGAGFMELCLCQIC